MKIHYSMYASDIPIYSYFIFKYDISAYSNFLYTKITVQRVINENNIYELWAITGAIYICVKVTRMSRTQFALPYVLRQSEIRHFVIALGGWYFREIRGQVSLGADGARRYKRIFVAHFCASRDADRGPSKFDENIVYGTRGRGGSKRACEYYRPFFRRDGIRIGESYGFIDRIYRKSAVSDPE